jgi:dGTPase
MDWITTSPGFRYGQVGVAHQDSKARIDPGKSFSREEREAWERIMLCPQATLSVGAGNRAKEEAPDGARTCFERDRDRILHKSKSFRKLAGKTQVFVFPHDGVRTRLTHTLEVAQIATSIAQACRLNVPLAEAIALGHDCGHGPFGHASEDALMVFKKDHNHATFGADVVLAPLNLTQEVLDGVRNHSWSRPAPLTLEGEVVSWADRIAYVCHDFEDAVLSGICKLEDLPKEVVEVCGGTKGQQISSFVDGLICSAYTNGVLGLEESLMEALSIWRTFNYNNIYTVAQNEMLSKEIIHMLRGLVEYYAERIYNQNEDPLGSALEDVVTSTDRYVLFQAQRYLGINPRHLLTKYAYLVPA